MHPQKWEKLTINLVDGFKILKILIKKKEEKYISHHMSTTRSLCILETKEAD